MPVWDNIAHQRLCLLTDVTIHTGAALRPVWEQLIDRARAILTRWPISRALSRPLRAELLVTSARQQSSRGSVTILS